MPSTMQDIARECGLSMMTVSRVLNGRGASSAKTREKVLAAAARLDYEINALAQGFARKRSGFIGIAAPFAGMIGSAYFGEIVRGFQRVFEGDARNYALFDIASASFDEGKKLERLWKTRAVEGLLVVAPHAHDRFLDAFSGLRIPLVVVGKKVANKEVSSVACDDGRGIGLACAHLYELGHRRIAFVGGPLGFSVAQARERAYVEFCQRRKLDLPPEFVQRGDYGMGSGREAGLALLDAAAPPTAVVAANDMMAFGVVEAARKRGIAVPSQLSVAGFDDLPTAAERVPSLTTVHQPVAEMAEEGARLLLRWLERGEGKPVHATKRVALVVRESTAAPGSNPGRGPKRVSRRKGR